MGAEWLTGLAVMVLVARILDRCYASDATRGERRPVQEVVLADLQRGRQGHHGAAYPGGSRFAIGAACLAVVGGLWYLVGGFVYGSGSIASGSGLRTAAVITAAILTVLFVLGVLGAGVVLGAGLARYFERKSPHREERPFTYAAAVISIVAAVVSWVL